MTYPIMMHYDGKSTPHIVIEVNQKCNITCRACYKNRSVYTKPFEQIKQEIDYALKQRDIDVITLAGGEPTLNDDLPKVIRYASAKGVKVNLLSNGVNLSADRLKEYREAGLDVIHVHVDSQQRRPDVRDKNKPNKIGPSERELNALRDQIVTRIAEAGIYPALSMTLYKSTLEELPDVLSYLLSSEHASECLITLYADFRGISEKLAASNPNQLIGEVDTAESYPDEVVTNAEVSKLISEKFGLEYSVYIASNKRRDAKRWIFYWLFALSRPGGQYETMNASPGFMRLLLAVDRLNHRLTGRHRFMTHLSTGQTRVAVLLSGLLQLDLSALARSIRFLGASFRSGMKLSKKSLYVQEPPRIAEDGEIELCRSCPDATVRNGEIMPLCLADILSPVQENAANDDQRSQRPAAAMVRLS